jgi:hypothetical protein
MDRNGSRLAKPDKNDWYETVKLIMELNPMVVKISGIAKGFR